MKCLHLRALRFAQGLEHSAGCGYSSPNDFLHRLLRAILPQGRAAIGNELVKFKHRYYSLLLRSFRRRCCLGLPRYQPLLQAFNALLGRRL